MSAGRPMQTKKFPCRVASPSGLTVEFNANGSIRRIDCGEVTINLFLGTEIEGGPANIYLRSLGRSPAAVPLLGPRSPARVKVSAQGLTLTGEWCEIHFSARLLVSPSAPAWFWHVSLRNTAGVARTVDLIFAQDLGLSHYGAVRTNEYYVSHYIDHTPLSHPERGFAVASRQNLPVAGKHPWVVIFSLGRAVSFSTDALQFHGLATRAGKPPLALGVGLPGARHQHEHSMVGLQEAPVTLGPGEAVERGFAGWFEADHPAATSESDLACIDRALGLPQAKVKPVRAGRKPARAVASTLFSASPILDALELSEKEVAEIFGPGLRELEREDGRLLSFFAGKFRHVVLKAKELESLRPHGHILRTGRKLSPEEASLTSTTWMAGVFHSMMTQGHVSINRFLSATHSYLGLLRADGLRVFVELEGCWHLLDVPSAYEMSPDRCRWIYKHADGLISVTSGASTDAHELTFAIETLAGSPRRFLLCLHVALGGDDGSGAGRVRCVRDGQGFFLTAPPDSDVGRRFPQGGFFLAPLHATVVEEVGGDELLFLDRRSRDQPFFCLVTGASRSSGLIFTGRLVPDTGSGESCKTRSWEELSSRILIQPPQESAAAAHALRLEEIMPWFIHNALIHYLAPRGLEQYTGGGWGTRDVCQGPLEMLLALGRLEEVRDLLLRVFEAQNPDGDWPQWFMFFERERGIRAPDSHGDIVFWPLLALARYLAASQDESVLHERVPFFEGEGHTTNPPTVWQHVERALSLTRARVIPGTRLAAYGNGDWNDSMQPAQAAMRERLCSSWTVTLHYQTLTWLARALAALELQDRAAALLSEAARIREEFERFLIVDDTVAGFAYFHDDGRVEYLLHPRDRETGISYSLLPMVHGVLSELFTPEQAEKHLAHIEVHLLGPDGARLFDRPPPYRGGPQRYFQRAESAAFFGREIALMYTHAHLRYAAALWHCGLAERFFRALCQANPIGLRDLVPAARLRQCNCYHTSSDAAFADRYQAFAEYGRLKEGKVPLDGGWRVYSSGPGIATSLIVECLLGLRRGRAALTIDPVIPKSLDGLRATIELAGFPVEVSYHIEGKGFGPKRLSLNGADLPFARLPNPYRGGGAQVAMEVLRTGLTGGANRLEIWIG